MGKPMQWFERQLVRYWAWREHPAVADGGPPDAQQPSDNLMRAMSLVMPLADPTAVGRAQAAAVVASGDRRDLQRARQRRHGPLRRASPSSTTTC